MPLVELERSGVVESVHTGHLIVLDAEGAVRFSAGKPEQPELALGTASHSGSVLHRELIAAGTATSAPATAHPA